MKQTYNLSLPRTSFSQAGPLLQFAVAAGKSVEIIDVQINQETATASAQHVLEVATMAVAATGGSATTPARVRAVEAAETTAASGPFTDPGVVGEIKAAYGWNVVNGSFSKIPVPDARFLFSGGEVVALRLATPITSPITFSGQITIIEG